MICHPEQEPGYVPLAWGSLLLSALLQPFSSSSSSGRSTCRAFGGVKM